MTQRASWMVHSTVDEPLELIVAFVAHYLELGADLVHLCLDRDRPDVTAVLGGRDRVRLTICDDAYWADGGIMRPARHTTRQVANARVALMELDHDWMLFCDGDEFLVPPCDFGMLLARRPKDVKFLRIRVAERALIDGGPQEKIFDGVFRTVLNEKDHQLTQIYGADIAPLLAAGVVADVLGKSVVRRDVDLDIDLHYPVPLEAEMSERQALLATDPWQNWAENCYCAHFDGLTPRHYLLKLLQKHMSENDAPNPGIPFRPPSRIAQIAAVVAALSDPAAADRLRRLHWLNPDIIAQLRRIGGIADIKPDPEGAVRRQFPELDYDYSAANFNKALDELHAGLIARTGFSL